MAKSQRAAVPMHMVEKVRAIIDQLPKTREEDAWVGVRWRIGGSTIAHLFGGEDQRIRICFRGEPDDVVAFENLGEPYYRAGWASDMIGMILDDETDWDELAECLVISYCLFAPKGLVEQVTANGWTRPSELAAKP